VNISDYCSQTIQVHRRTGNDTMGQGIYAAPVSVKARVEHRRRMTRDATGEMLVSDMQVFAPHTTQCAEGDRITYAGVTYHVMSATIEYAFDEPDHLMVWTGRTGS